MPTSDSDTRGIVRYHSQLFTGLNKYNIVPPIIMPAYGPWKIFGIYSAVTRYDVSETVGTQYTVTLNSLSGDMYPGSLGFSIPGMNLNSGFNHVSSNLSASELIIYDTDIDIAAKATIQFVINWQLAMNQTADIMCGIIFGHNRPVLSPIRWLWNVTGLLVDNTEILLGTLTMTEDTSKIISIMSSALLQSAVPGGPTSLLYSLRLTSDDKSLQPLEFPGQTVIDSPVTAAALTGASPSNRFLPVNIEMLPGSRVNVFATGYNINSPVHLNVFLQYE